MRSEDSGPEAASRRKRPLVLLVDDEIAFLGALERYLRRHGFRVVAVSSGELALRALELWPIFGVVADYHMPEIDGLEVLDRVDPRLVSVRVLLTGDPFAVAQECERRGIVVLDKSDTTTGLLRILEEAEGRSSPDA
ncbi:MAG TPA: response regulator [Polyangiaceae bacterium]